MKINDLAMTFHTERIRECADFYVRYLGAKPAFDHDWYITVKFDSEVNTFLTLSFMHPDHSSVPQENDRHQGYVTLNVMVPDIDLAYESIKTSGLAILRDLAHMPWGDRSFVINDPLGNVLYIWTEAPMSDEYKASVK